MVDLLLKVLLCFLVQIKGSWSSKRTDEESGNPYTHNSILTNCCATLCGPMPPRWVPPGWCATSTARPDSFVEDGFLSARVFPFCYVVDIFCIIFFILCSFIAFVLSLSFIESWERRSKIKRVFIVIMLIMNLLVSCSLIDRRGLLPPHHHLPPASSSSSSSDAELPSFPAKNDAHMVGWSSRWSSRPHLPTNCLLAPPPPPPLLLLLCSCRCCASMSTTSSKLTRDKNPHPASSPAVWTQTDTAEMNEMWWCCRRATEVMRCVVQPSTNQSTHRRKWWRDFDTTSDLPLPLSFSSMIECFSQQLWHFQASFQEPETLESLQPDTQLLPSHSSGAVGHVCTVPCLKNCLRFSVS